MDDNESPDFNQELVYDYVEGNNVIKAKLMDSNTFSDTEKAHIDIDISEILAGDKKIDSTDFKLLGEDKKELKATINYSVEVVVVK
jgi:hypothetical protein